MELNSYITKPSPKGGGFLFWMSLTRDDEMRNFVWKWCMTLIVVVGKSRQILHGTDGVRGC